MFEDCQYRAAAQVVFLDQIIWDPNAAKMIFTVNRTLLFRGSKESDILHNNNLFNVQ